MSIRPKVPKPIEYGSGNNFWVEYPSGLVDISRTDRLPMTEGKEPEPDHGNSPQGQRPEPPLKPTQIDVSVDGERVVRIDKKATAIVIIDMQK